MHDISESKADSSEVSLPDSGQWQTVVSPLRILSMLGTFLEQLAHQG
jgi:hypothetical protein